MGRICFPSTTVPDYLVEKVEVPTSTTLYAGDIIKCEALKTGSREVYAGAKADAVATEFYAMVITQGVYEESTGARPAGHPYVGEISYGAGKVITVIRLVPHLKFEMSQDCVTVTEGVAIAKGKYLIPVTTATKLATAADLTGGTKQRLIIEALDTFGTGGKFAMGYEASMIVRVLENLDLDTTS